MGAYDSAKSVVQTLLGSKVPGWVGPAFGVAAAAPIVGNYLQTRRESEQAQAPALSDIMEERQIPIQRSGNLQGHSPQLPPGQTMMTMRSNKWRDYYMRLQMRRHPDAFGPMMMGSQLRDTAQMYGDPGNAEGKMAAFNLSGRGVVPAARPSLESIKARMRREKSQGDLLEKAGDNNGDLRPDVDSARSIKGTEAPLLKLRKKQTPGIATG